MTNQDPFTPGEWKEYPGYNTPLPEDVHVPGKVKTSLGKLKFDDLPRFLRPVTVTSSK